VTVGVLALLVVLAVVAAGCGGGSSSDQQTTTRAASGPASCHLSAKQRRVMKRANRMIADMHRLEAPLKTVHDHGPTKLELELNSFMLSIGVLPVFQRELLIREAKAAVGLCHDCFEALESMEPAVQTRAGESPCAPGV
jgi:hypothetical protein